MSDLALGLFISGTAFIFFGFGVMYAGIDDNVRTGGFVASLAGVALLGLYALVSWLSDKQKGKKKSPDL